MLLGCTRAEHDDAATWPQWQPSRALQERADEPPAPSAPTHALASGVVGLSARAPLDGEPLEGRAGSDDWAEWPAYGSVFHHLAHVFEAPQPDARAVGYYRRGALLRVGEEAGREGCEQGWHAVWGGGFVCRGQGYRLHGERPASEAAYPAPSRLTPLPYRYVKVVAPVAQTWRIPTPEEEKQARGWAQQEADRATRSESPGTGQADAGTPGAAADAGDVDGGGPGLPSWLRMFDAAGHYLSIAEEVQREDGRVFLRTVRGAFVPRDATLDVQAPNAPGVWLDEGLGVPLVVARRSAKRFRVNAEGEWSALERLPQGQVLSAGDGTRRHRGHDYLAASDGTFVEAARAALVRSVPRPVLVPEGARWVHVDLPQQTLVAYQGDRPVFVTLISSGKAGYETPAGLHRIHAKHVSTTMDDLAMSDGAYYIEDVPWTMYFQGSYALHAAFWHDRFGTARSHGCVNLAPGDARALFEFLQPDVPGGRHGVLVPGDKPSYVWVDDGRASPAS